MRQAMTAEELLAEMKTMPLAERSRFFTLLASNFSQDDNFSHEQVFGHLDNALFTAQEAAEYLEVSIATFRRYVQSCKLKPSHQVGRSQMFATPDLRAYKQSLRDVKRR